MILQLPVMEQFQSGVDSFVWVVLQTKRGAGNKTPVLGSGQTLEELTTVTAIPQRIKDTKETLRNNESLCGMVTRDFVKALITEV